MSDNQNNTVNNDYDRKIHWMGRITLSLGFILSLLPPLLYRCLLPGNYQHLLE